ncbi:MAG: TonB-dependent receptor [Bacteroidales bacterium]|jgi:iron complex outermembrane receptor protein
MRRIINIFFFLPLFCVSQNVQYATVSGIILNASDNKPLPNANIFLSERNINCASAYDGSFSLSGITAGNYILTVSYIGYQKYQKKFDLKEGQNLYLKVFLKDTSFTSKEIQVRAFKNKGLLEQPMRMSIIRAADIQSMPAQSMIDILDYTPGVSASNTTGIFANGATVTMHGMSGDDQSRTLVILDGVPLNKADQGSVNWNMINKDNIDQITVIKGPGPAKYGGGAMGGVIEMTSKKPVDPFQGDVSIDYGTYNTVSSNIDFSGMNKYKGKITDFYWGASAFGRRSDGYITEPPVYYTTDDTNIVPAFLREINTSFKAGCDLKNNQNIELQLDYFDDMRGNGFKVFDQYGAYEQHGTYKGNLKYSGAKGFFKWKFNAYMVNEDYFRIYEYMNEKIYSLYQANSTRLDDGGNFELSFYKYKNHDITAGIDYKFGGVNGTDTYFTSSDIVNNAGKMDNYAAYIQDEIVSDNKKFRINAGLRFDFARFHNGLFDIEYPSYTMVFYNKFNNISMQPHSWNALCPRLSSQYQFSEKTRIYISAAEGFRAPILDDMCRSGQRHDQVIIANPDLKPELIYTLESGLDFNITKKCTADMSVYYSIGKDFMYYTSTGDSVNIGYALVPVVEKQNISKVEIYGAESEVKYELSHNFLVFVNYSYTHAQISKDIVNNPKVDSNLTGKYLTDIPIHKAGAGIIWKNKIVNTTIMWKYIGKAWINDWNVDDGYLLINKYPDYSIINIRFEREIIKHFNASLGVENLFNKIYIDSKLNQCPGRFITIAVKYSF